METLTLKPGEEGTVVALGFFDSIHIGHRALIASAEREARRLGAACAVFTFRNGVSTKQGAEQGLVYPYEERLRILRALRVQTVIAETFTPDFRATAPGEFLDRLFSLVLVRGIVCGEDYSYGADKAGDVATLREECRRRRVPLKIERDFCLYGEKVSTSRIKLALAAGDLATANALLGAPFTLTGEVVPGRRAGRVYGYPTCNQRLPADKFLPRRGVYGSVVRLNGATYRALTNLGAQPTFGFDDGVVAETHLLGYEGDLYGRVLTVELHRYLRGVQKFASTDELYRQLEIDRQWKE